MSRRYMSCLNLLIAVALLTGCGHDTGFRGGSGLVEADGTLVSAETSGRVVDLRFAEGQAVSEGDTLAVIDPSRVELQLKSARAGREVITASLGTAQIQVDQASRTRDFASVEYDRISRLVSSGTANEQQRDKVEYDRDQAEIAVKTARANVRTLESQLVQAEAEIAQLERQLEDCYPLSPMSGVVTEKLVDQGELLSPGKAVVKLARLDTVWVKIYLPSGDFAQVRIGDEASVSTESGGQEFSGRVIWTSEEAEFTPKNVQTEESRADLVYAVKVQISNEDRFLKIGMPVFVTLASTDTADSE